MKLVQLISAIADEAAGPSYSVVRLCESLIACGHEVTLAALDWAPMTSPPSFLKPFPLGLGPRRLGRSPALNRWLRAQAASRKVDLLHNHGLWMMPNVYPGRVAQQSRVPLVVSPRGMLSAWALRSGSPIKRVFWPTVQRPALVATFCFHATAESEYRDIRQLGFRQPVVVLPNGVDIPELMPRRSATARTLLFLSRVHPTKGLDMLLSAWAALHLRFPDWQLKVVGSGSQRYLANLQRLAGELRLERIEFRGPLYGREKWQAYAQANLFVLPTHSENFGMSVAEALAAGTPAIVTKGAPWQELSSREAGWWIDIGVDPLVAGLERAMSLPASDLNARGLRGRAWMEQEFSWTRVARKMSATYEWVVKGGEAPNWVRSE